MLKFCMQSTTMSLYFSNQVDIVILSGIYSKVCSSRYLIASHLTDYKQPMFFLNTIAVFVLVVAKFPNMHKVRIFGINADI